MKFAWNLPRFGRLERKVLLLLSAIVVVPMLTAGWLASEWVSSAFEKRLERWLFDAARANQNWLQAYQSDAVMLGRVLADDPRYVSVLAREPERAMPPALRRISQELGINLLQVYDRERRLLYSSIPIRVHALWDPGQSEAVLKVTRREKNMLAAVGITPIPRAGEARFYLVLGSLLADDFAQEIAELTGLTTRLYYREGGKYYDVFSPDSTINASINLPAATLARLEREQKSIYDVEAQEARYRGVYTPLVDSSGRVEAIMFNGLARGGWQDLLTNRLLLFGAISLVGVLIGASAGLFVSGLLLRPLGHLRDGVLQLAGQNFNAAVPENSDDEFGDLAKAFNAMAARLRAARDEQAQRFQKDKLAALGELSAALAHEIRNPIGVINASAALLEKQRDDPKRAAELIRMIRVESLSVGNLVQDFLDLSRYRAPEFQPVDPVLPLERALASALPADARVTLNKRYRHDGASVFADAGLLQQAWTNIVTNALEAMGGRGELDVSSELRDDRIVIAAEDSGPGIAPEIMPRLFEPFFTTKEKGTGLGLTIANTLVEANGGRLRALPGSRSGARFAMELPLYRRPEA